jgi:hypothetical protein
MQYMNDLFVNKSQALKQVERQSADSDMSTVAYRV